MTDQNQPVHVMTNGDSFYVNEKYSLLKLEGKRRVLSTSAMQTGYSDYVNCIFNYDEKDENGRCSMEEDTYEIHLMRIARDRLSLDPAFSAGFSTAADMKNYSIREERHVMKDGFELVVTAITTGGIDKNGARVGDPTDWVECNGRYEKADGCAAGEDKQPPAGTINTFIHINARLSHAAMVRAIVTATEAKTAAVQELMCPSLYSDGLATGSGTDGVALVCEAVNTHKFTQAGKDTKLGELIGKAVKASVAEAIGRQTGVTPEFEHHVLRRLDRFGLNEKALYETAKSLCEVEDFDSWIVKAQPVLTDAKKIIEASVLAHLLDQKNWGLLSAEEIREYYGTEDALKKFAEELCQAIEA